jgi:hypothetical protein
MYRDWNVEIVKKNYTLFLNVDDCVGCGIYGKYMYWENTTN